MYGVGNTVTAVLTVLCFDFIDWLKTCSCQNHQFLTPATKPRYYNPNHGYQPYWPGGQFAVIGNTTTTVKGVKYTTGTTISQVCGEDCDEVYHGIGPICTRDVSDMSWWYVGCNYANVFCNGYNPDQYRVGYKTFKDYCSFLNSECSEYVVKRPYMQKYIYVYEGKCIEDFSLTFPTFHVAGEKNTDPGKRKDMYLKELCSTYHENSLNTTPCGPVNKPKPKPK